MINVLGALGDAKMCKVCDCPLGVHTLEKETQMHPQLQKGKFMICNRGSKTKERQKIYKD